MLPTFLIPMTVVIAVALLVPRTWLSGPRVRSWAVQLVLCGIALVALRYLSWRVETTLPVEGDISAEAIFAWGLFGIEVMVWIDTAILFLMLSRPRDNSADADRGEARLRATNEGDLPTVDVFIATYNEDLDVLEKTIIGAQSLDWPSNRLRVCILDDGKRDWLRDHCAERGVDYFTRETNEHAKAGNINAAIARTEGEFFLVLDADFIPQENFLYRAMGLFEDPKVGIVQIPHSFYNPDPMQANLRLRKVLPDDQRLFFGTIMAGRDGWNAAFCCGSNSITRRSAMEEIGNKLPTGSITEDMLLTLALLRKGYATRYLNERLAIGLAPESLSAMYVQRARWARGAVQIMFLKEGPFGPGLKWHERLMFIPLHWLAQPLVVVATLLTPLICLWTGWSPLRDASTADILFYQLPTLVAVVAGLRLISPNGFFPVASMVHTCIQAPRIIPTVLTTLIRPHGHAFKVTPKGQAAGGAALDKMMVFLPAALIIATGLGIYLNADINTRVLESSLQLPLLVIWAVLGMIVLTIVQAVAISSGEGAADDFFPMDRAPCFLITAEGQRVPAALDRMSLSAARLHVDGEAAGILEDVWLGLEVAGIGTLAAHVARRAKGQIDVSIQAPEGAMRERLIQKLYTQGHDNSTHASGASALLWAMLLRAAGWRRKLAVKRATLPPAPTWLRALP